MTKRIPFALLLVAELLVLLAAGTLWIAAQETTPRNVNQDPQTHRTEKEGELLRQRLNPPVRAKEMAVTFSPDGLSLMLQSQSGIYVHSVRPLKLKTYIFADEMYQARFSEDSNSIVGVSLALQVDQWDLGGVKGKQPINLKVPAGCLAGELSPNGQTFACYRIDMGFSVYDTKTGDEVMHESGPDLNARFTLAPLSLPLDNIEAGPLGFAATKDQSVFANRGLYHLPMAYSPGGDTLIAGKEGNSVCLNLAAKRKRNLPNGVKKRLKDKVCLLDANQVLTLEKSTPPEVLSLESGEIIQKPNFTASAVRVATNPGYLLLSEQDSSGLRLFELKAERIRDIAGNVGADIREDLVAVCDERSNLLLFRLGEKFPFASAAIPLDPVPPGLQVVASPALDLLAMEFGERGGIYRVSTGQRLVSLERISGGTLPNSLSGYFLEAGSGPEGQQIVEANINGGTTTPRWKHPKTFVRGGGAAFFEYTFESYAGHGALVLQDGQVPFSLKAMDMASGRVLWKKDFPQAQAVPFIDPQGNQIVLGWVARSEDAKGAAKRCPLSLEIFKRAKLTSKDTFFEVLEGKSGNTIGGVLVQSGSGPANFEAVFSAGGSLLLSRGGERLAVYSLRDGQMKARLTGFLPAASGESGLLVLAEDKGRLGIYELSSGRKLGVQNFSEPIAYTHFSEDGKRLLVLTRLQQVYVLDMENWQKVAGSGQ